MSFAISKIAIIQSLDPGDFETGTELGAFIDGLRHSDPSAPEVDIINVNGGDECLQAIERLTVEAETGGARPVLQIETHGWEDKSGLAFSDGSTLTWQDLAEPLAALNKATRFNLLVCMSACFGGHALEFIKADGPSPCFGLIGPTHSVDPGELLGGFRSFYREWITTLDANLALAKLHADKLQEGRFVNVTAEQWFFWIADGYLKNHCTTDRLRERTESITADLIRNGKPVNDAQRAAIANLGSQFAYQYLDRRFPAFFMLDAMPENRRRFGASLDLAKRQVADFMATQG